MPLSLNPDYHVHWEELNISIPTYPHQIPVMSINRWIIFHHRLPPYTDFNQSWSAYVDGFGSSDSNYWMGLEKIYQLTKTGRWKMRLDAVIYTLSWSDLIAVTNEYASFYIDSGSDNYTLHVSGWSGSHDDILNKAYDNSTSGAGRANGSPFNTQDHITVDHGSQCWMLDGGWWFSAASGDEPYDTCDTTNLNGGTNSEYPGFPSYYIKIPQFDESCYLIMAEARMMLQLV